MPRSKRIAKGGIVYHALNRANGRLRIFKKARDFEAFEELLAYGWGELKVSGTFLAK